MKLLAVSWAMPPLVFPRAIQVARLLDALRAQDWHSRVVAIDAAAVNSSNSDAAFAALYAGAYTLLPIETREAVRPSPWWLRLWRRAYPPDDLANDNWRRRALAALRREVRRGGCDVFVSFAQPWIDHLVGLELKRACPGLPWVAHFSDPWIDSPYRPARPPDEDAAERAQERAVIEGADALMFVNAATAELVMRKYAPALMEKVHVVSHGFDRAVLGALPPLPMQAPGMRVVYAGNFYGHRQPLELLEALAEVMALHGGGALPFAVDFIGNASSEAAERATALGLGDAVRFLGPAPYLATLAHARAADLLLVIDAPGDRSVFLPSKVVDYLMLERPILGITPARGPTSDVLRALGFPVVEPLDRAGMARALADAFARWQQALPCTPLPAAEALAPHAIAHNAQAFAAGLEYAMRHAGPPR